MQPFVRDGSATLCADAVGAVIDATERAVELRQVVARLIDEGEHLGPLESDGRALGVVLVVGNGERGRFGHRLELLRELPEAGLCLLPVRVQLRFQHRDAATARVARAGTLGRFGRAAGRHHRVPTQLTATPAQGSRPTRLGRASPMERPADARTGARPKRLPVQVPVPSVTRRPRQFLRMLGPGLVAGASDVDPTTVATIAVIGATTVFALSWLTVLVFPVLAVILVISSRVGVVTGQDLQTLVRSRFGRSAQLLFLGSILVVTILTLAADLEAGAAAAGLLLHMSWRPLVAPVGIVVLAILLLGTFDELQKVLKYVVLVLLAYVASALVAHVDWTSIARHTFVPTISFGRDYIAGALALLGTTLTSYVYVWHTIELAEERPSLDWLRPKEADALVGIFFAVVVFWFILVTTGATLGAHHQQIQTAQDAAAALKPIAGSAASTIFGIGLLGSALLALPVLMGTVAYVVGAEFDWRRGLSEHVRNAPAFYAVIAASTVLGAAIAYSGISPIRLLFIASIVGGIGTPVTLVFLLLVASDGGVMNGLPISRRLALGGWAVTTLVSVVSLIYLANGGG